MVHEIRIRERAYAIWEQEGRPEGREWDHWVRAVGEVDSVVGETGAAAPVKKTARKAAAKPRKKATVS